MKKYVHTFSKNHPLQACGGKEKSWLQDKKQIFCLTPACGIYF